MQAHSIEEPSSSSIHKRIVRQATTKKVTITTKKPIATTTKAKTTTKKGALIATTTKKAGITTKKTATTKKPVELVARFLQEIPEDTDYSVSSEETNFDLENESDIGFGTSIPPDLVPVVLNFGRATTSRMPTSTRRGPTSRRWNQWRSNWRQNYFFNFMRFNNRYFNNRRWK